MHYLLNDIVCGSRVPLLNHVRGAIKLGRPKSSTPLMFDIMLPIAPNSWYTEDCLIVKCCTFVAAMLSQSQSRYNMRVFMRTTKVHRMCAIVYIERRLPSDHTCISLGYNHGVDLLGCGCMPSSACSCNITSQSSSSIQADE